MGLIRSQDWDVAFSALDLSYCVYNNNRAYVANGQVNSENRSGDRYYLYNYYVITPCVTAKRCVLYSI